jgi:hypothetical protein
MPIFDALIKPALDSANAIISQFHTSPEEKLQAQQALAELAQKSAAAASDYDVQLNNIAGQNIRSETGSGDKFTSRARPSFLYVIIAVMGFNYIGLPLAQVFGSHVQPIVLPGDLLTLFGTCICGYSFARTAEKIASMPGNSQVSVLGVKIGQNSQK